MIMKKTEEKTYTCQHCGAEADLSLEGFDSVDDVLKRKKKLVCKGCGQEISMVASSKEAYTCSHCGAEADMTLEGFEGVEDVIKREKKLACRTCGQDMPWTEREDLKALRVAVEAEMKAYQHYSKSAKKTKNPKGKDMFQQLSEFELNHYQKLKELLKSLEEKGKWILYSGTSLKKKTIPLEGEKGRVKNS
jgi:DNA-directed RNA polymerase subunit RPC12/RpoP